MACLGAKDAAVNFLLEPIDEDLALLTWRVSPRGYIVRSKRVRGATGKKTPTLELMHRVVAERAFSRALVPGEEVDHINGDKCDNRRSNLRVVSHQQNLMNRASQQGSSSRMLGVHYQAASSKWVASIQLDGKRIYVGGFKLEEEAAWMRDQWAVALHGEYARLNFHYE